MPKVSVVIPLYNYGHFLPEAVESVVNQTFRDYEILIIDDCSTDNSLEVAEDLAKNYRKEGIRIVAFQNERNRGLSYTRNKGFGWAYGEYLLYLDPDDTIDPTYLEETVPVLDSNIALGFVYPDTEYFGETNHRFYQQEYNFFDLVMRGNFISYCSLIRKKALEKVGGFDRDNWGFLEDYQNWINLGRHGWYGRHIPKKLFNYRVHKSSAMQSGFIGQNQHLFKAYFIKKYPEIYPPEFQKQADEILKGVPENFMKMSKKENEAWWINR